MLISTSKFFQDDKIVRARRASAIVAFEIFPSPYYTKLQGNSCHYLLIMYMEKSSQKVKTEEIFSVNKIIFFEADKFVYSHYLISVQCIDIIERSHTLVNSGSYRLGKRYVPFFK